MNKLIPFLRTRSFIFICVVLTMLSNLQHIASVYYSANAAVLGVAWFDWALAYTVVLVVDLSVLAFVFAGRHREAKAYAWAVFCLNLIYYSAVPVQAETAIRWWPQMLARVVFAGMFTYSVYIFSKMISEQQEEQTRSQAAALVQQIEADKQLAETKLVQTECQLAECQSALEQAQRLLAELEPIHTEWKELKAEKEQQLQSLKCVCGYEAKNDRGLHAHKQHCKHTKN